MNLILKPTGEAAGEPVTLAQFRAHVRVDDSAEDALLLGYLLAASNDSQAGTGVFTITDDVGQTSISNRRVNAGTTTEANFAVSVKPASLSPTTSMMWTGNSSAAPRQQLAVLSYSPV